MNKSGRTVLRWIGRIVLGVVVLVVLLAAAGIGWQWFASTNDARAYPPPGELVDVGGHRLHIFCMGEGSPAVILDALGDGTSAHWGWVQPAVEAHAAQVAAGIVDVVEAVRTGSRLSP